MLYERIEMARMSQNREPSNPSVGRDEPNLINLSPRQTVLLVDDDEYVRHALRVLFEVEEFEVVGEAADGVEAIALGLKYSPDFIIIDYSMPRMNGEKAALILQTAVPTARIVAFSAYLESKPDWAHAYLNKERILEIIPVMQALLTTAPDLQASRRSIR
jgi:chemotaxis response regulator CheB